MVAGIQAYRWVISPAKTFIFGPLGQCRFTPSCSAYALQAISRHGALAGSWLAIKRIGRCHPWGGCGDDPVPEKHFKPATDGQPGIQELPGGVAAFLDEPSPSPTGRRLG